MRRASRWICMLIFLMLCTATIWFLQNFMETQYTIQYIEWQSALKIESDGSTTPLLPEDYTKLPDINDTFQFKATLPPYDNQGNLIFETSGLELTVILNGETVWSSFSKTPDNSAGQTQAIIPLPENTPAELVMNCTFLGDENILFPPFPRFVPMNMNEADSFAYANLYGIPAGANALFMILIAGLFLTGILHKKIDWSLIPLFLASAGLTVRWISQGLGYYFLPQKLVTVLSQNIVGIITFCMLVLFLIMNRRRDFWRYFAIAAGASLVVFLASYIISLASGSYFAKYINLQFDSLIQSGYYDGLLYWITVWMTMVCTVISAYTIMRSFARQQVEAHTLNLKNQLILNSYHAIERKVRDTCELRHEMKHKITTMEILYKKGDYDALGDMLSTIKEQNSRLAQTSFTENFTINAILQDAASRASDANISFQAQVCVPPDLTIPENDLCKLLMNMLDNAIEAAEKIEQPKKRFIHFFSEVKNGFLAIKCENSFTGTIIKGKNNRLLTQKDNPEAHGYGLKAMSAVSERYHSILDISYSEEDNIFTVQTALQLPK